MQNKDIPGAYTTTKRKEKFIQRNRTRKKEEKNNSSLLSPYLPHCMPLLRLAVISLIFFSSLHLRLCPPFFQSSTWHSWPQYHVARHPPHILYWPFSASTFLQSLRAHSLRSTSWATSTTHWRGSPSQRLPAKKM